MSKVAIITRTKNRPLLLRRAISSVANQTYKNYVHIIVNDGDPLEHQTLTGGTIIVPITSGGRMEYASNTGLQAARREGATYAVIHDDDDSWSPEFLRVMVQELQAYEKMAPSIKGILCRANKVFERIDGNVITTEHLEPHAWVLPEIGLLSPKELLDDNKNFAPIQFMYNLAAAQDVGDYKPEFRVYGDWEFNLRFLRCYDIALIPQYLAFYHLRINTPQGSASNSITTGERSLQREVYRQLVLNNHMRSN